MHFKPDWKKLLSAGQKLVPDWKELIHKGIPYVLAVVFASATFLSVLGVRSANAEYISLQGARNELETEKQNLQTSQQELENTLAETKDLVDRLSALNADMQTLLERAETEEGQVSDKIDELLSAFENVEDKERQRWVLPMQYLNISSPYGFRSHPIQGQSKFHYGIDLAADRGTPIVASRGGTVSVATYEDGAGYYVVIDHLDGYKSYYMHMDKYIVSVGQFVVTGQIIGYCGSSGNSTGNHLHFEICLDGKSVNPADYIDF